MLAARVKFAIPNEIAMTHLTNSEKSCLKHQIVASFERSSPRAHVKIATPILMPDASPTTHRMANSPASTKGSL